MHISRSVFTTTKLDRQDFLFYLSTDHYIFSIITHHNTHANRTRRYLKITTDTHINTRRGCNEYLHHHLTSSQTPVPNLSVTFILPCTLFITITLYTISDLSFPSFLTFIDYTTFFYLFSSSISRSTPFFHSLDESYTPNLI